MMQSDAWLRWLGPREGLGSSDDQNTGVPRGNPKVVKPQPRQDGPRGPRGSTNGSQLYNKNAH